MAFGLPDLNPQRRKFAAADAARIRQAFIDAGAKLGDPLGWDDTVVDLNPIDMSYHGYVPSDIAQRIDDGRIPHANIPCDFHHTAYDDHYALMQRLGVDQSLS